MIVFDDVSFSYSDVAVLHHINFKMEEEQFIGILGPNGGGKSTFLKLVLSLLKPTLGKINVSTKEISYISQVTSLNDGSFPATVKEVVSFGLVSSHLKLSHKQKKQRIEETLKKLSLTELSSKLVTELSGGQLQRVKIAKALVSAPKLLVLDEPDAGMDEESHHQLIHLIEHLHEEGVSILFVSHHPHDLEHADKIYFIENGQMLTYEEELERGHHHVDL